ncbi:MAG: ATP-binding protein [Sediminispirochaetaceae bacterium]
MHFEFPIEAGDFSNAGSASSQIKKRLKQLNIPGDVVKKAVVAMFEAEVNVVGHSFGGTLTVDIDSEKIRVVVADTGPGIPDIDLAMSEGYSTATEQIREMGFGAGMGLPNIKKSTDKLEIQSGKEGTRVEMLIYLDKHPQENGD